MDNLVDINWTLNDVQKKRLVELYCLTTDEQENFFSNIECQVEWMPLPKGYKPLDTDILVKIIEKARELRSIMTQLDRYHKDILGNSMLKSVQTLTSLSTTKTTCNSLNKFEEQTKRNILKLDHDSDTAVTLNSIHPERKPITFDEDLKALAKMGEIDFGNEVECVVKTTSEIIEEWPHYKNVNSKKLNYSDAQADSLSKIKVETFEYLDPVLAIKHLESDADSMIKRKGKYKRLEVIIQGLAQAFGCISTYDGTTGKPNNPERVISANPESKFIKYLSIVLTDIDYFKPYEDLESALSQSMKRSNWFLEYKELKQLRTKNHK